MRLLSRLLLILIVGFAAAVGFVPGASASSPRSPEASIERLYQAYFNRQPDDAGLRFWVSENASGRPLLSIAEQFGSSPEFVAAYGALGNGAFVDLIYTNVLDRTAEADGRAFWIEQLDSGAQSRAQVMTNFSESSEFVMSFTVDRSQVERLYEAYFLRAADRGGMTYWLDRHVGGDDLGMISAQFAASPEFVDRYGDLGDQAFLVQIYRNVFERAPDAGGLAFWLERLESGALDRGTLMLQFSESDEFIDKLSKPPLPEPEPEPEPCVLTQHPDVGIYLTDDGNASIGISIRPQLVDCDGQPLGDPVSDRLITMILGAGGEVVYELVDVPENEVPLEAQVQVPTRLIGDNLSIALTLDISYRTEGSAVLGAGSFAWVDELAVTADLQVESAGAVIEPDLVDTVSVSGTLPAGVTSRQVRFTVARVDNCGVVSPLHESPNSFTVFEGAVGPTFEFSFEVEVSGQCSLSLTSSGVHFASHADSIVDLSVLTLAPTDIRLESSSCTEFRCTATFSAVRQSELDPLVEFSGFSDEHLVANVTSFFGRVGTAPVGERVFAENRELNRVDSFCFLAAPTNEDWVRGDASEIRCADLVGDAYVERALGDELHPLARGDEAAATAGQEISIPWWENDRVRTARLVAVEGISLLGGTVEIDDQQLRFTGGTPGTATFDYTICDETDPTPRCSTATVSVVVTACVLPPLRYRWDALGSDGDPTVARGNVSTHLVDCSGRSLSLQDVTMSGAVGTGRTVYREASGVSPGSFDLPITGIAVGPNGTVPIEGWYSYELLDGTVVGRGTIDEVVEVPVNISYTATVDSATFVENAGFPTMTVTGTLGAGVSSRQIRIDMGGCAPKVSLGVPVNGTAIAFNGRVDTDFSIDIPLVARPCGAQLLVYAMATNTARPMTPVFVIEVVAEAPAFAMIEATTCADGTCSVAFSAQRRSSFLSEIAFVGWSMDGTGWNTISQFGTPGVAGIEEVVAVTATFAVTPSFCAAPLAESFFGAAAPYELGELLCADLVDGQYVQRAPTEQEAASYAS